MHAGCWLRFPNCRLCKHSSSIPSAWITLPSTENHLVTVFNYNYNYSEGLSNRARLLTNQIACFTAAIIYNVCSQLGLYILKQFQV